MTNLHRFIIPGIIKSYFRHSFLKNLLLYLSLFRNSIAFGSNFQSGCFDGFTLLRSSESENNIFRFVCMYVCVRASVISIIKKQITGESSNLAF